MILTTESALVQVVTTATPNVDVNANWADVTATTFVAGNTNTKISSAATTTIVGSPAASTQRQIKSITVRNIHATDPNTVSVLHTDGTTSTMVYKITLAAGESAEYDGQKWQSYNAGGQPTNATTTGGVAVADIGSTAMTVGGSVDNGTAATASRSDHKHAITNPKLDDLATPDNNTDLNANTTNHGLLLIATAPAAGLMNFVGLTNGETAYTNKALFDTTNPAALGAAAPGTEVIAARRDHVHAAPTTVTGNAGTVTIADAGGDTSTFPLLGTAATGSLAPATDAQLTYNATTNTLATDNLVANTAVLPDANDGAALGTTALQFSDLFLAEGGVINWDNGDATLTQASNVVTLAGATLTVDSITLNTSAVPDANDGAALGTTALQFSDLFLAEGGVINFDNGDVTITQVGNVLTITGGSTVVDSLEIGHATDTTLTRVSAGLVAIEGNNILTSGGALGTPSGGTVTNLTGTASININGTVGATTPSTVVATTITPNTSIILQENAPIILDPALSADGKYSGITMAGTAGAALAFGDLCYLAAADSRWELADADAEATAGPVKLGICVLAAAGDASATTMLLYGNVRADTAFPTMTISAPLYVGTTAGDIQVAAPSGAADIIRVVGWANTADELHFQPSGDWFEHA